MKIKLAYPKIPNTFNCPLKKCIVVEKMDGTNLHWVFNKELGWHAFGTRRDRFDLSPKGIDEFIISHPELRDAVNIFNDSYRHLENYLVSDKYMCGSPTSQEVIIFTEFLGEHSFAGTHQPDDPKYLHLLDVMTDVGFIPPHNLYLDCEQYTFISGFMLPKIIYSGKYNGQLIENIRQGKYSVKEGAIIKGMIDGQVYMAKVKTNAYMEKLKLQFKDNWKNYWE